MNGPLVRWLFDLETIPEGAEGLRLVWERAWPPWLWALLVAASVLFAVWSYRRLAGARSARGPKGRSCSGIPSEGFLPLTAQREGGSSLYWKTKHLSGSARNRL